MFDGKNGELISGERCFRIIDRINFWVGRFVSYLVLLSMLTIVYEVICRYFFNSPTGWVTELNIYLLCIYVLLAGGVTLLEQGHVRVDLFWSELSDRKKAMVDLVTSPLFFAFVVALVWKGSEMAIRAYIDGSASAEAMAWPLYPSMIMVPLGGFLLGLQGLAKLWRDVLIIQQGER